MRSRSIHVASIFAVLTLGLLTGSASLLRAGSPPDPSEVLDRYLAATQSAQNSLRGKSMQVDISASLPKLKKEGRLQALRNISQMGRVTYRMLGFTGDKTVKKDVIARYLTAEVEASGNGSDLGITPANYKFKFRGLQDKDGNNVYVFQLTPRKKEVGLFKGELWIDPTTFMPVREQGKFVKNPSIFFKRTDFVRTYKIDNGVAFPNHIDSVIKTRVVGPVEISINFHGAVPEEQADAQEAGDGSVQ